MRRVVHADARRRRLLLERLSPEGVPAAQGRGRTAMTGNAVHRPHDEAAARMLEALAEGLRRQHPRAIIEVVADEAERDALLDAAATRPDAESGDTSAHGAQ